jgi:hypothetical protein
MAVREEETIIDPAAAVAGASRQAQLPRAASGGARSRLPGERSNRPRERCLDSGVDIGFAKRVLVRQALTYFPAFYVHRYPDLPAT